MTCWKDNILKWQIKNDIEIDFTGSPPLLLLLQENFKLRA